MGCARFVCRGWEGSLLSFSPWMRILRLLLLSSGSTLAFFHVMHSGGFHGSKYDSQSLVLDFVQPALVGLSSRSLYRDAYTMVGRTVAVYTFVRIDESSPQVVPASFLIKASFCRLLLPIFSICGFQVSRVSSFTPRKMRVSVWGTISSFSCSFICSFVVEREKRVLFVLLIFISRPQSSVH